MDRPHPGGSAVMITEIPAPDIRRIARTQSSTTRNYTPEFSTFERIAGVNPSESAMDRPHPGGSAVMITEIPAPDIRRIARTQSSTTRNYTPEFSTFERIAGVNPSESAMDRPHPGGSAVMITEIPAPDIRRIARTQSSTTRNYTPEFSTFERIAGVNPSESAMDRPHPGGSAVMITEIPAPDIRRIARTQSSTTRNYTPEFSTFERIAGVNPSESAMDRPHPGGSAVMITEIPAPDIRRIARTQSSTTRNYTPEFSTFERIAGVNPSESAMDRPHPGGSAVMITEIPAPDIRRIARTQSSTTRNYTPEFSTFERIAGVNPSESAMDRPHPGGSAVMITEIPAPDIRRIARTQSSTTRNYTPEFSTFERIAGVNPSESAMDRPHPGGSAVMITEIPAPDIRRIARTQSSTTRNYTPEFSTFERIAGVNPSESAMDRPHPGGSAVMITEIPAPDIRRIARTQSSTTRNYTPEFSTFERIAGVNPSESAMDRPHPGGSAVMITEIPAPGKYALTFCDLVHVLLRIHTEDIKRKMFSYRYEKASIAQIFLAEQ
ncbi:hypothetical protein BSL78_29806 [Apostichopus japonicus]|uniref:Uncharacterized protein n=1 Tax=Stichopus japonicus TaxID=307972 RepID=A0A2G8JCB7_STIJA|nr:hypothetical protein BSL78_29806 [Apostichopus japonicus]